MVLHYVMLFAHNMLASGFADVPVFPCLRVCACCVPGLFYYTLAPSIYVLYTWRVPFPIFI